MTVLELYQKGFYAAIEELMKSNNDIMTYKKLKKIIKSKIDGDNLVVAAYLIEELKTCGNAEYYIYNRRLTFSSPIPITDISDLEDFCDGNSYTVMAHINSLDGEMDEVRILETRQSGNQKYYIVKYKNIFCTAIYNGFNCTYYADDKYGRIEQ